MFEFLQNQYYKIKILTNFCLKIHCYISCFLRTFIIILIEKLNWVMKNLLNFQLFLVIKKVLKHLYSFDITKRIWMPDYNQKIFLK